MSTVFSYDQGADTVSRIKNSRNAINEVFADFKIIYKDKFNHNKNLKIVNKKFILL